VKGFAQKTFLVGAFSCCVNLIQFIRR
jgi:hypothetical protein